MVRNNKVRDGSYQLLSSGIVRPTSQYSEKNSLFCCFLDFSFVVEMSIVSMAPIFSESFSNKHVLT